MNIEMHHDQRARRIQELDVPRGTNNKRFGAVHVDCLSENFAAYWNAGEVLRYAQLRNEAEALIDASHERLSTRCDAVRSEQAHSKCNSGDIQT